MRVLIVTAGSRGDVAPFTGLGRRLMEAGHQVTVAAHAPFVGLLEACGLDHRPLPGDPRALIRARAAATNAQDAAAVVTEFLDRLADGVAAAVADSTDLVLTAFGPASLSRTAGETFAVPVIGTYLAPAFATAEFPLPGAGGADDLGPGGNLAAGQELLARSRAVQADVVRRLRERLDLPPAPASEPVMLPVFHGFSSLVVPQPGDWPSQVEVTGYWWPERPRGWQPPAELVDFLQAGSPPVFVGFGSMAPDRGEELGELTAAALNRARVRGVVQAGWAGLSAIGDDVLMIDDIPHDWLFPRTAAVVHHAGAGTTGAGLRAGVPAVPVPVMADQPFWAGRLHRLGVAPEPLPLQRVTAKSLAQAIKDCVTDPAYRERATRLARDIEPEDGAAAVLAHVNALRP